jgi:hypothetical protein
MVFLPVLAGPIGTWVSFVSGLRERQSAAASLSNVLIHFKLNGSAGHPGASIGNGDSPPKRSMPQAKRRRLWDSRAHEIAPVRSSLMGIIVSISAPKLASGKTLANSNFEQTDSCQELVDSSARVIQAGEEIVLG